MAFDKCDWCGTMHQIEVVNWGGFPTASCPHIPKDVWFLTAPVRDPDEDNPISSAYRGSA